MTYQSSEFSETFIQGMRDRMQVSYHKYGPVADAYPGKVSALESLQARLDKYMSTGNTEFLMEMGFIPASHRQPGLTCSCCSAA